jgi:hypothetical protein
MRVSVFKSFALQLPLTQAVRRIRKSAVFELQAMSELDELITTYFVFYIRAHIGGGMLISVNARSNIVYRVPAPAARAVVNLKINHFGMDVLATRVPACLR